MDMTMILVYTQSLHTHTHIPIDTHTKPLRAWRQLTAGPCACFEKRKEKQKLNKRKLQCYANPAGQHKALNTTSAR